MTLIEQIKAARRVSTPLIGITTPDPVATMAALCEAINSNAPRIRWDLIRAAVGLNESGAQAVSDLVGGTDPVSATGNPAEMLSLAAKLPKGSLLFFLNAHRYLTNEAVCQAICNLRDLFKADRRTLVLLAPSFDLPIELAQDVLVLDEPLPSASDLQTIVTSQYEAAGLSEPPADVAGKAVDALRGLAAFPAEQVVAMSLTKQGVDLLALWERKRRMIEQTPGLSVWRGGERFEDIGGVENVKQFLRQILAGEGPPRAIVFIDEIEKAMAGSSGSDTSGVSQEMLGMLLTYMQDAEATGMIFIGPPGSAKSMVAKAAGNTAEIPTISFDLAGMKASLVGESTANLRMALKVVSAVSDNAALFIATCNSIGVLPPELRRRFTFGTFYFSLPDAKEREVIWRLYLKKYSLPEQERPQDEGWTGAEIKQCSNLAWRLKCSLLGASAYIVPVAKSAADQIERLQQQASGRFISASYPGVYRYDTTAPVSGRRAVSVEE